MSHSSTFSGLKRRAWLLARSGSLAFWFLLLTVSSHGQPVISHSSFEDGLRDCGAEWTKAMVPLDGLTLERASDDAHRGQWSLAIRNHSPEANSDVANNWMIPIEQAEPGDTLELSAFVRTKGAAAVNLCLQVWDEGQSEIVGFASTPRMQGTHEWQLVRSSPVVIGERAGPVFLRAVLVGRGEVWFDDVTVTARPELATAQEDLEPSLESLIPGNVLRQLPIVKDCMVLQYLPDWRHGKVDNIAVANNSGGVRTLMQWSGIDSSEWDGPSIRYLLAMYVRKATHMDDPGQLQITALDKDWPEVTSWKTQPPEREGAAVVRVNFAPGAGWKLFDVSDLVREGAPFPDHGVALRFVKEQRPDQDPPVRTWSGYSFVSREGAEEWAHRHPRLLVVEDG